MRNIITPLFLLSTALTFNSFATTWQIRDTEYTVDTLQHVKIGPGTTATQLKLNGAKKFRVFYTTTNLDNSKVDVRTVKANNKYASCATVPAMAQAATTASGETYFAGVNADFFGNSAPIGYAVVDGDVYRSPMSAGWASFGFGTERKPVIGASAAISATAIINGTATTINGINVERGENNLILYSPQNGSDTGTNPYGTEVLLEPVDGKMGILGRTTKMKVVGAPVSNEGKMNIPANGYVLSGHGTAATLLNGLTEGTEIEIKAWASYDGVDVMDITQMAGGQPVILKDCVVLDTEGAIDHLVANNPRTAVGYNDKNELVMLVVDGRSAISDGCVSKELADIMKNVGCSDALNFDGGGSSTMYCGPKLGIINNPSDGNPRSVTNGLFLVATGDETNNEIAAIEFKDADSRRTVNLPQYGIYTPEFYGFNNDEILVDTKVEGVTLSLEGDNAAYGEVTNDGKSLYITAAEGNFVLTANYNGVKKSVPVAIKPGEISKAHKGVLFLDELPEYSRSALEALRQPLEDKQITVSRAGGAVTFPADFMLCASMNPCPCGNYGSTFKECTCTPAQIKKYRAKISGPLLDRIDLQVEVDGVKYEELASEEGGESSAEIKKRVEKARAIQRERFGSPMTNASMGEREIKKYCQLSPDCERILKSAFERLSLSARARSRIIKVARTIADLDYSAEIKPQHILEATSYRNFDVKEQ